MILAFAPPALADGLPDLGDTAQLALTPQMERRVGESIMRDIRLHDPDLRRRSGGHRYLNVLGNRLVANSQDVRQDFEFFLVKDPTLNAFALPGGYIGVNTGTIVTAQSESELAAVLAHEIAHVTQHHMARMASKQGQLSMAMLAAMALAILARNSQAGIGGGGDRAGGRDHRADRLYARIRARGRPHRLPDAGEIRLRRARDAGVLRAHAKSGAPVRKQRAGLSAHPPDDHRAHRRRARTGFRGCPTSRRRTASISSWCAPSCAPSRARRAMRWRSSKPICATRNTATKPRRATAWPWPCCAPRNAARARRRKLAPLLKTTEHPMLVGLACAHQAGRAATNSGALAVLQAGAGALSQQPRAQLRLHRGAAAARAAIREAAALLDEQLQNYPRDARLYALRAKGYAALGKRLLQHQAQAEVYVLQGSLPAAIEQLQLAQKSGDGDFYQLSSVDARLRDLRAQLAAEKKEKKENK